MSRDLTVKWHEQVKPEYVLFEVSSVWETEQGIVKNGIL